MWGGNGKNHSRSMGYHWLVALFLLSAEIANSADHVIVDGSVEVYNSNWETYLNGIDSKLSDTGFIVQYLHNISDDSGSIRSSLSSFKSANHSDLSAISSFLAAEFGTGSTFDTVVQRLYSSFYNNRFVTGGDYVLQTVFPETMLYFQGHTNATVKLAVSDLGVQQRLDKIIDLLSRPSDSGMFYTNLYSFFNDFALNESNPAGFYDIYDQMRYFYDGHYLDPDELWADTYSPYTALNYMYLSMLDFDNPLLEDYREDLINLANMIVPWYPAEPNSVSSFSRAWVANYGTYDLRSIVSNFVYSAVQGNETNMNVLAQLISPSELSALFSQSGSSNAVMATADFLSSKGLVTTNGVYQSEYSVPTNVEVLADIDTNAWGNSSYSAYVESFDPESVSNTVSRFDFQTFFSDSLDGAIDSIDVSDVGDYVLEFGNLTLGDWFSYTIPSITIPHNETWLDFADKFLLGLKAFATCGFFLVLWRHLSEVT